MAKKMHSTDFFLHFRVLTNCFLNNGKSHNAFLSVLSLEGTKRQNNV